MDQASSVIYHFSQVFVLLRRKTTEEGQFSALACDRVIPFTPPIVGVSVLRPGPVGWRRGT